MNVGENRRRTGGLGKEFAAWKQDAQAVIQAAGLDAASNEVTA